jgi:hypothetical protein
MAQNQALLSRITIKTVCGEIKKPTKETLLMRVYGQANGFKAATSQFGDSLGFLGVFKAVNADTGEEFRAGKCFLPKVVENQLGGILSGSDNNGVEFAFDIGVKPANNAFGYEYVVRPVLAPVEAPVIEALESKMGKLPALGHSDSKKK